MRHIPFTFILLLLIITVGIFFISAYAIAEGALIREGNREVTETNTSLGEFLRPDLSTGDLSWYESTAFWVCPLH